MNKIIQKSQLASIVILAAMSTASFASGPDLESSSESQESTYWGLGIGSVLGGVIAGPPGIAIGATLGGALGWGQEQQEALVKTQDQLIEKEALANERTSALIHQNDLLKAASAQVGELKRRQKIQIEELSKLRAELAEKNETIARSDLVNVLEAYTQEVYFEKGKAQVPVYAEERIADLATFLKRYPDLAVTLTGYTDQSGPASFNEKLSKARAEGVRDALHAQGVELERMAVQSQGESLANIDKSDHGNAILDRRVAIELNQLAVGELISNQKEEAKPVEEISETTIAEWVN